MPLSPHLSKSRYIAGLQCKKRLWFGWHDPAPAVDAELGSVLGVGHEVGELARGLFPGGVLIDEGPHEFAAAVARTRALVARDDVPAIFEAAFAFRDTWVRADVLARDDCGRWRLLEVKSSTRVKPEYEHDLAIQRHVIEGAGVPISSANLICIDRQYRRGRSLNIARLFRVYDLTAEVRAVSAGVEDRVREMLAVMRAPGPPERRPGAHCFDPYACDFWDRCTKGKPVDWVWNLPGLRSERFAELDAAGIESVAELPDDFQLTAAQRRVVDAYRLGGLILQPGLGSSLKRLKQPCRYLDFETFSPAVPLYRDTRPYQRIPAQWSLHSLAADGSMQHAEFLADLTADPRRAFAESLLAAVGARGPVVVYSAFEGSVLRELEVAFPDLGASIARLRGRLFDLLPVVRSYVDHPDFGGSNSIKDVAPVLTEGVDYHDLGPIAEGVAAAAALYRLAHSRLGKNETAEALRAGLLRYCARDTLALAKLHAALAELAQQQGRANNA